MEIYSTCTNEELVEIIRNENNAGREVEAAYEQLFRNLRPITLHEAEMYRGKMDTYSTEDFLQEGNIVAWEIISRGNITRILVESDYAKEYRQKKAEQQKRWYEKKKAAQPPKEKKPPMTKEERSRRVCAYQKKYYAEHPDKLAERREKNRIAEKARRERKKAERLAAQAAEAAEAAQANG